MENAITSPSCVVSRAGALLARLVADERDPDSHISDIFSELIEHAPAGTMAGHLLHLALAASRANGEPLAATLALHAAGWARQHDLDIEATGAAALCPELRDALEATGGFGSGAEV